MKNYIVTKKVKAKSIADAIKKEKKTDIFGVFEDDGQTPQMSAIGFTVDNDEDD